MRDPCKRAKEQESKRTVTEKGTELLLTSFFALLLFCSLALITYAQDSLPLQVAPARQELKVSPGETISVNVRFYNLGEKALVGLVKVADFIVNNKEGNPRIIEDAIQLSPKYTASHWYTLSTDKAIIAANDKVGIEAKIKVPLDAHPGGRYSAIYFEPTGNDLSTAARGTGAGVGVSSRIAALIYFRVAGDITENALISKFFAPSFFEYGPIKVETEILNRGDYHIAPSGIISLTDMFGGLIAQEKLKEDINIFPDAARSYVNELGSKWMFGRYRMDIAASYGEKGQALTRFIYVWVIPWKIVVIITLTLILLILLGRMLYKNIVMKQSSLETEVEREREEIQELKEELKKKDE